MFVEQKNADLRWGSLDLSMSRIDTDWFGRHLEVPAAYGLAIDSSHLWFVATRNKAASISPQAGPGEFVPELWKYDVAEFFLSHPSSGRYLEFNLAPNGAWWSAEFVAPRVRDCEHDVGIPGVKTYSEIAPDGQWQAAASIPLDFLEAHFDFGKQSRMNVTFIVDSPAQKFLTASSAATGEPDFHLPDLFEQVSLAPRGSQKKRGNITDLTS